MFSDFEEALFLFMRGREILAYAEEIGLENEKLNKLEQEMQVFHINMIDRFYEWQYGKIETYLEEVKRLGDFKNGDEAIILNFLNQLKERKKELNDISFSQVSPETLNQFYIDISNQFNDFIKALSLDNYKDNVSAYFSHVADKKDVLGGAKLHLNTYVLTPEGLYFNDSKTQRYRKVSLNEERALQKVTISLKDNVTPYSGFSVVADKINPYVTDDENQPAKLLFKNRTEEALSGIDTLKIDYSQENFTNILDEAIQSDAKLQLFTRFHLARNEILDRNNSFENLRFSEEDLFLFGEFLKDQEKTPIEKERLDDFLKTSWKDVYLYRFELKDLLKGAYRGFSFGALVLDVVAGTTFEKMWDLLDKATALIALSQSFKEKRDLCEANLNKKSEALPDALKSKFTGAFEFPNWITRKPVVDEYFKENPEMASKHKNFIQELNIFAFHHWANSVCTQCYQFSLRISMPLEEYIGKLYKLYDVAHQNPKVQYEIQRIAFALQLIKSKADASNEKQRRREYEDECCKMLVETREKIASEIKGLKKEKKAFIESLNTYFTKALAHKPSHINEIINFFTTYVLKNPLSTNFPWIEEIAKKYEELSQKDRGEVHENKPDLGMSIIQSVIAFPPSVPPLENNMDLLEEEKKEEEINFEECLSTYPMDDSDDVKIPEEFNSLFDNEVSDNTIDSIDFDSILDELDVEAYRGELTSKADSSLESKTTDLFKSSFDYKAILGFHSDYAKKEEVFEESTEFKGIVNTLGEIGLEKTGKSLLKTISNKIDDIEKKEESENNKVENEEIIIAKDENFKDESLFSNASESSEELEKEETIIILEYERKEDEKVIIKLELIDDDQFELEELPTSESVGGQLIKVICEAENLNDAITYIKSIFKIFSDSEISPAMKREAWRHAFSEIAQRYPERLHVMGRIERKLLSRGISISIPQNMVEEAINVALIRRNAAQLQGLLQYTLGPVHLIQKTCESQNNLVQRALLTNNPGVVQAVIGVLGDHLPVLLHKNAQGQTALHIAAQQKNGDLLDALLAGIPANMVRDSVKTLVNGLDGAGVSPFETAFRANNIPLCLGLLKRMNALNRFYYLQKRTADGKPFIHFFLDGMERLYENSDTDVLKELKDFNLDPDQWNVLLKMRGEDGKISYERMKNYEVRNCLLGMTGEHSHSLTNAMIKRYYHHAGRDRFHLFSSRRFDVLFRGANFQGDELKTVLMAQYELSLKEASLKTPEEYETEVNRIREEEPLYPVLNKGQGLLTRVGGLFGKRTSSQKGFERLVEDYRPRNG